MSGIRLPPLSLLHRESIVSALRRVRSALAPAAAVEGDQDRSSSPTSTNASPMIKEEEFNPTLESTLNVKIQTDGLSGHGLARHRDWWVIVPHALESEEVTIRVTKVDKKGHFLIGKLLNFTSENPARETSTLCPHFSQGCMGCSIQHIKYKDQLKRKLDWLHSSLLSDEHIAQEFELNTSLKLPKIVPNDLQMGYKTRIAALPETRPGPMSDIAKIGFLNQWSWKSIIDAPSCPLGSEIVNKNYAKSRDMILGGSGHQRMRVIAHESGVYPFTQVFTEDIGNISLDFNPVTSKCTSSPSMTLVMLQWIKSHITSSPKDHLFVPYARYGLYPIALASLFRHVTSISDSQVFPDARRNALGNNAKKVKTRESRDAKADYWAFQMAQRGVSGTSIVLIDSPSAGCQIGLLDEIISCPPDRIIYIADSMTALLKDLPYLLKGGSQATAPQEPSLIQSLRNAHYGPNTPIPNEIPPDEIQAFKIDAIKAFDTNPQQPGFQVVAFLSPVQRARQKQELV